MSKYTKPLFMACVSTIILVGVGSRKISLAYPDFAWLVGTVNGMLQILLLRAAGKYLNGNAPHEED